jgi:adenylosuccinate synthase
MEKTLAEVKEGLRAMAYDFAVRIEPVYKVLNWKWANCGVPNADDLEENILRLIDQLEEGSTIGSGGIDVSWTPEDRCYSISFTDSKNIYY